MGDNMQPLEISHDFETRSTCDLRKAGAYKYARDPNTSVWCLAYDSPIAGDIVLWRPGMDIGELRELAQDKTVLWRAHNAQFERNIWNTIMVERYGLPEIALERYRCTAAEAAAMSLPRALENAARVLGVSEQKDKAGHNLMMRMARPRKVLDDGTLVWWDDEERQQTLGRYCIQDVKTEKAVAGALRRLPDSELAVYRLDQRINDRGIMLDSALALSVADLAAEAATRARKELKALTGGAVEKVTARNQILTFLRIEGAETESVDKENVRRLLAQDDLSEAARRVLEIRQENSKSSVSKVNAMFASVADDGRMHGALLYHGANTGRWAGRLIQPQNLPARSKALPDDFHAIDWVPSVLAGDFDAIDLSYPVLEVAAMQLRGCLRAAPGKKFIGADFAQIEARVTAWLAGEEWILEAFAAGKDLYKIQASKIYKIPAESVQKPSAERDMGKRVLLGCQFQMGAKKFILTCAKDDVYIEEKEGKQIIDAYRAGVPNIVELWSELNECAIAAVKNPGANFYAAGGKLLFTMRGSYLWIRLPSQKRALAYFKPKIAQKKTPWGTDQDVVRFWGEDATTKQWHQMDLYGGLLTENVTQATARDIMVEAMFRLEERGYAVILTVHDEVVCEVDDAFGSVKELQDIMAETPAWAHGLPVKAEGWTGPRYSK
jgi:DNA polymerase